MIFTKNESVEDAIVRLLSEKESSVKALRSKMDGEVSLQALYKALKQLDDSGVVVKRGTKISLSKEWAIKVANELSQTASFPELGEKESVTYSFQSFESLDRFWKHVTLSIQGGDEMYPVFFYEPHEMWIYLDERAESQREYLKSFEGQKRNAYLVVGSNSSQDMSYKREFQDEFLRIDSLLKPLLPSNRWFTIIGDHIVMTQLESDIAKQIDVLYKENPEDFVEKLNALFKTSSKIKFKLEKNKSKAKELRKKLSKNFVISKELIEQFDLF